MPDAIRSAALKGRLTKSTSGWILLRVPNNVQRGFFDALHAPGAELPMRHGRLNTHISVIRPEELKAIGNPDVVELGRYFSFQLGPLKEVNPIGWDEMDRVWFIDTPSQELVQLRRSYGLTDLPMRGRKELRFHLTIATRKKGVLRANEIAKEALDSLLWKKSVGNAINTVAALQDTAANTATQQLQRRWSPWVESAGALAQLWDGKVLGVPNKPSALSSALVMGLLGAGLGYGGGRLIGGLTNRVLRASGKEEIDDKLLARNLALAGGAVGPIAGAAHAYGNYMQGEPVLTGAFLNNRIGKQSSAGAVFNADEFQRLVYEDPFVSMRLNPREQAMATGLVVGAQNLPGKSSSPLVSPIDIARVVAGMGAGYMSGALVGNTLGRLMGLPGGARDAIIRAGTFSGAIKSLLPLAYGE